MPSAALWAVLAIPVIWFGLLCGGAAAPGRTATEWFDALTLSMEDPLRITICRHFSSCMIAQNENMAVHYLSMCAF